MNKKKLGFFALLIGMALITIGIILSTVQSKKDKEEIKEVSNLTNFEKEVHEHAEYIQDVDEDPFNENKKEQGDLTVDNIDFNFEFIQDATYENTAATLIDSTENILLFHNYNNVLSFYDKKRNSKYVVDEQINQAIVSPDEQYIIYSKNAFNKEAFYYLDLETLQNKEFDVYYHGSRMKVEDMKYKDGLLYFIVKETETGKTSIHFSALPSYLDSYTATERKSSIKINVDELYSFNNEILTFNKDTNALEKVIPNNPTEQVIVITSEKVKDLRHIDFYDEKRWAISITNDKDEYVLITPNKKVTDFNGLMSANWFDKNHLIVNDNLSLYLYNLEDGKKHVIKTDISYVFSTLEKLTIQTNNGEILRLNKK